MLRSKLLLPDAQSAAVWCFGIVVAPLGLIQRCQIVQTERYGRVARSESIFQELQTALKRRLRLSIATLFLVKPGQISESGSGIRMLGSVRLLQDRQNAFE